MGKLVELLNKVEPVIKLVDREKVKDEIEKELFPVAGDKFPKVKQVSGDSRKVDYSLQPSQKNFCFYSIVKAVFNYLKVLIGRREKRNQFFYKEEQRKYELEIQLRKQWPHELVDSSFLIRREL